MQIIFVLFTILQASAADHDPSEEFSVAFYITVYLTFFELNFIGTLELYLIYRAKPEFGLLMPESSSDSFPESPFIAEKVYA